MTAALSVRALDKRLGSTEVLCGLCLEVNTGECLAVVGPNGAGKTTLFNLISGRSVPTRGQVFLHGRDITGLPPHAIHRLGLSRSFQLTQVFGRMTVEDNLRCASLAAKGRGTFLLGRIDRVRGVQARVEDLLERLGLVGRRDTLAAELSYAEQRALELGLALAGDPSVLLLDEPTAGMNREESRQAVALIRALTRGRTLLVVEHDMGVVFELADRVAVLDQGRLLALGSPDAVRTDPRVLRVYRGLNAEHPGAPC